MKIKDIPDIERPRERMLSYGPAELSNEDLLAILLKNGTKEKSVKEVSLELLSNIHSITELKNQTISSLSKIKGIGTIKAIELLCAMELGKRVFLTNQVKYPKYQTPNEIWNATRYLFQNKKQEHFYCLYFNHKQELVERKLLFMGTINKSIVHPREVFKEAYLSSASSIVCIHNHPSNDLTPSKEDIRLTKALVEIGELNGIPVVDHIITTEYGYYSFMEHNMLH